MIDTLLGKRLKEAIAAHEKASTNLKEITDRYVIKREENKQNGSAIIEQTPKRVILFGK